LLETSSFTYDLDSRMKILRLIMISVLAGLMLFVSLEVYHKEQEKRVLMEDLVELSDIKYGMFNVDTWAAILADIITKKVEGFDLTNNNRDEMKKRVSAFLYTTISDFEDRYYKTNKGVGGFFRKSVASMTDIFGKMKDDIPLFTDDIVNFLDDPENKKQFKAYIMEELTGYATSTFSEMDYSYRNDILAVHGYESGEAAIKGLRNEIGNANQNISGNKSMLYALILATGLVAMLLKRPDTSELMLLTVCCFILLMAGLSLPMIDIDARISEMNFSLLGEDIGFTDQVLYFKSKSILEIVQIMLLQGSADVLIVGLLVFLFSVLFPLLKLFCSCLYLYVQKLRKSPFIQFIVFKTGKWSMADVMVIAIFMAYIGFSGILNEQLNHLDDLTSSVEVLTTNETQLQTGFFLFTAFVVISLLVSHRMQYNLKASVES